MVKISIVFFLHCNRIVQVVLQSDITLLFNCLSKPSNHSHTHTLARHVCLQADKISTNLSPRIHYVKHHSKPTHQKKYLCIEKCCLCTKYLYIVPNIYLMIIKIIFCIVSILKICRICLIIFWHKIILSGTKPFLCNNINFWGITTSRESSKGTVWTKYYNCFCF